APLPRRGARPFAAEERPRPLRVERATLVGADPARTCREDRVADGIERLRWHEYDELAPLAAHVLSRGGNLCFPHVFTRRSRQGSVPPGRAPRAARRATRASATLPRRRAPRA